MICVRAFPPHYLGVSAAGGAPRQAVVVSDEADLASGAAVVSDQVVRDWGAVRTDRRIAMILPDHRDVHGKSVTTGRAGGLRKAPKRGQPYKLEAQASGYRKCG